MVFPIMLWWQRNHWADHIQRWCFTLVLWPGTDWMSLDPYVLNCCFCFFYYFLYFFSFRLVPFFRNCHIKSSFSSYKRNIYIFSSNVLTLYHSIISFFCHCCYRVIFWFFMYLLLLLCVHIFIADVQELHSVPLKQMRRHWLDWEEAGVWWQKYFTVVNIYIFIIIWWREGSMDGRCWCGLLIKYLTN